MNRSGVTRLAALTITVCAGLVTTAFGQTPTVEFGIYSANTSQSLAGVYTDPYMGYTNGDTALGKGNGDNAGIFNNNPGTTQVAAFCDDFTNDVTPPQYWNAYDTSLASLNSTSPVYYDGTSGSAYTTGSGGWDPEIYDNAQGASSGGGSSNQLKNITLSQTADYIAVAYLAYESQQATGNASLQEIYSYGLWGVFDPSLLGSTNNPYGSMSSTDLNRARADLSQALGVGEYYAGLTNGTTQFENNLQIDVEIYTPVGGSPGSPGHAPSGPQEFVTVTPTSGQGVQASEASSWASMGFDLSGVALLALLFRRRLGTVAS